MIIGSRVLARRVGVVGGRRFGGERDGNQTAIAVRRKRRRIICGDQHIDDGTNHQRPDDGDLVTYFGRMLCREVITGSSD